MQTITLHASEPVYADFEHYTQEQDCPASALAREPTEALKKLKILQTNSLLDLIPSSVGVVLKPWNNREDLVGGILGPS